MHGIRIIRYGGLGDVAMALCTTKTLKQQDLYVEFLTAPIYADLAKACPYVDTVISDPYEQRAILNTKQTNAIYTFDIGSVWHGLCGLHELDSFLQEFKVYASDFNKTLTLNISESIQNKITDITNEYSSKLIPIILHPGVSDPHRTWPIEYWDDLIEKILNTGLYKVIIIGAKFCDNKDVLKIDNPDVLDLCNKLSILETVELMRQCSNGYLISCDSGPIHLAGATNIKIIGIFSVVKPENRLPYRHGKLGWNAVGLMPSCIHAPCFLYMHDKKYFQQLKYVKEDHIIDFHNTLKNWCLEEGDSKYKCMKQITPEMVFREIK